MYLFVMAVFIEARQLATKVYTYLILNFYLLCHFHLARSQLISSSPQNHPHNGAKCFLTAESSAGNRYTMVMNVYKALRNSSNKHLHGHV